MRQFVVLTRNGDRWKEVGTVESLTADLAIQNIADGEGTYVAVPAQHWAEKNVAPKTIFAVVEA